MIYYEFYEKSKNLKLILIFSKNKIKNKNCYLINKNRLKKIQILKIDKINSQDKKMDQNKFTKIKIKIIKIILNNF